MSNTEPPPLDTCVLSLKKLTHHVVRSNSPKELSELYLSAIGLLCRLKEDQATLQRAWKESKGEEVQCPPLDRLPAMSAVVQDPNLFHALLACLRAPTVMDGNTSVSSISGDSGPLHTHSHGRMLPPGAQVHNPPAMLSRKRSHSFIAGEMESNAPKAMKIQHSPLPMKKKVHPHGSEVNADKRRVQINVRVLAATILYTAFQHLDHWPVQLIRAYAEDSFGPRSWVDDDRCALLTRNLELSHAENSVNENGHGKKDKLVKDSDKVALFYTNFNALSDDGVSSETPGSSRARASSSGSLDFERSPAPPTITSPEKDSRIVSAEPGDVAPSADASSDSDSGDDEECIVEVSAGTVSDGIVPKSDPTNDDSSSSSSSSGEEDMEVVETNDSLVDGDSAMQAPSENSPSGPISPAPPPRPTYPIDQEFLNLKRVRPRYFGTNLINAHDAISNSLADRLELKSKQNSRLLAALPKFVTLPEVRRLVARHLERWMQSPALSGPARTLFAATVNQMKHVEPPLPADEEAIDRILSMRLKANQLNAHIENVTSIAKRIPTASIARRLFLQLLREELATLDTSSAAQPSLSSMSDQLRMVTAVRAVLSPNLASDGLAEALLTLLANPMDEKVTNKSEMTRRERHVLVKKIRFLIRRIASVLGPSQFDSLRLVESLLSIDVDDASWSVKDEEDKGRLMFECVMMLAQPSQNPSESRMIQQKAHRKLSQMGLENRNVPRTDEEIAALRKKLTMARKLMLTWCCSDYAPMYQAQSKKSTGASPKTLKVPQHKALVGAGAPNFDSVLDGKSEHKKGSLSCLSIMRCVLFMVEPDSPLLHSFLHPDELPGATAEEDVFQERYRIQQCCEYGADLDDEMMRIVLQASATPDTGMDTDLALSLLEHLFESCRKGRRAALRLSDSKLVWELYKLVEYTPTSVPRGAQHDHNHDAYLNLISGVLKTDEGARNNGDSHSPVPRLAYPGMWWRATCVALVMCGVSPEIGAELWKTHPTLRCLIKMVTSNRYRFPTVDCDDEARETIKTEESNLREEEANVTEMLFLPPLPKVEKKTEDEVLIKTNYRSSRVSARQRAKQEKILREKREREKAQALAETRRRKKLLREAQKSIMLWDPRRAARKPPRESVDLILSVEDMFDLSSIFRQGTNPDFLLMTIGGTSRQAVERAYDWLIPVISALPDVITRLPSSASCFLLLRAEGDEASQLRELSAPLLVHVSESLTGKFGEDYAIRAADLLFADASGRNPDRRRYARRVLQLALSSLNSHVSDTSLVEAKCSWLFSILHTKHAPALIADCIKYISRGLAFERGRVLRAFVLALHRYIEFAKENGVEGHWDFGSIMYTLVSSRHNVCAEAMDRFPDFLTTTTTVVHREFIEYIAKNTQKVIPESEVAVQITPYRNETRPTRNEEGNPGGKIFIPLALLHAVCVLLSNWRDQGNDGSTHQRSKEAILDMLDLLLIKNDSTESASNEAGLAGATLATSGKRAVAVDQWVMLAKSRSDFVAGRAALSAPTSILPRLLLCSGLPRTSLFGMIDRIGKLGDNEADESKVFSQLLVPSATADWGVGHPGSRREISRKLLGRLSAYLRVKRGIEEPAVSTTFLQWLSDESRGYDKSRKSRQKKSPRGTGRSSSGFLKNVSAANCILSDLTEDAAVVAEESKVTELSSSAAAIVFRPRSTLAGKKPPISGFADTAVRSFVDECFEGNHHLSLENWLQETFRGLVSPPLVDGELRSLSSVQNDFLCIAMILLEGQAKLSEQRPFMTRVVEKWVPLLSQTAGSAPLWEFLFRTDSNLSQDVLRLLLCRCVALWTQEHISACQLWIMTDARESLSSPCLARMVNFLVLTSGQHSVNVKAFSRALENTGPFASGNEREVTAAVSLALECMKQTNVIESDRIKVDSRNDIPDWLLLLLLVARQGKKHMKGVTDAILAQIPKERDRNRRLACSAILRLYCCYPRAMNLGNAALRSLLMEAVEAVETEWLNWRSPLDDQLDDMLSSLRMNPHQRLVQSLGELSKNHPLLVLRKLGGFAAILEQDGRDRNSRLQTGVGAERRGRVQGDYLQHPLLAMVNGVDIQVTVRHWGYSFSEPLWLSVVDIISLIPPPVLFSSGLILGLQDLLGVFVRLLFLHSQLDRDRESRLRGRIKDLLFAFQTANKAEWDQWCDSPVLGIKSYGSTKDVLSFCRLLADTSPSPAASSQTSQ